MTNLTSRLAIKIRHLPDFEFSWSDSTPQRPRSALGVEDFLPNEHDATILKERAVHYIMCILTEHFPVLKHLQKLVPPPELVHPIMPSDVVPMKILFRDEKYKSETIEILSQLLKDAGISGDEQVCDSSIAILVHKSTF